MVKVSYWIEPGDGMFSISHDETKRRIVRGLWELSQMCDLEFVERTKEAGSNIRISFHSAQEMRAANTGGDGIPLGLGWGGGRNQGQVWILGEKRTYPDGSALDLKTPGNRVVESLSQHEFLETQNWDHDSAPDSIMNPNLTAAYPSANDAKKIQQAFGYPPSGFAVVTKQLAAARVRQAESNYAKARLAIAEEMPSLKVARATGATLQLRAVAHNRIMQLWDNQTITANIVKTHADVWHALAAKWASILGAL